MKQILLENWSMYPTLSHVYKCHILYEYCLLKIQFHTILHLDSSSSRVNITHVILTRATQYPTSFREFNTVEAQVHYKKSSI